MQSSGLNPLRQTLGPAGFCAALPERRKLTAETTRIKLAEKDVRDIVASGLLDALPRGSPSTGIFTGTGPDDFAFGSALVVTLP